MLGRVAEAPDVGDRPARVVVGVEGRLRTRVVLGRRVVVAVVLVLLEVVLLLVLVLLLVELVVLMAVEGMLRRGLVAEQLHGPVVGVHPGPGNKTINQ